MSDFKNKTDAEWKTLLTPEQFYVTRQGGTERPFTGLFTDHDQAGTYHCVCCGMELFRSDTKFHSGCGWPSFFDGLSEDRIRRIEDHSHGMHRIEVRCQQCDAHLGHVFNDGPPPTGIRYCINSVCLTFTPDP